MTGDNSGKQPASTPATESGKSSKHSNATSHSQAQSHMPQPPLPGMEPKPRPVPEMPEMESPTNLLSSLNYLSTHPDAMRPNTVPCCCGLPVRMDGDDWYTENYDGTVRCVQCSFCARCGTDSVINCRQQVSIGGHVLCYNCVKYYGDKKFNEHMPMPPIIRHPKNKGNTKSGSKKRRAKQQSAEQSEAHNICLSDSNQNNWWQSTRSPECRSLLRYRDYPRPVKYVPELDPTRNHIGFYTASRPEFTRMFCPSCKVTATGKDAYVVPGISLVYHRKCFFCLGCKSQLCTGVKRAGVHFVFCSCTPPMQWCTKLACTRQRIEHHATYKCFLEPIHPGGREQNDTRILFMDNLKGKEDKKTKKKAAVEARHDAVMADVNLNETTATATSASNMMSGLRNHGQQQYLKLTRASKPPAKDGRLLLPSPSSGTPAPSASSSSGSPQFSTAVAAAPPNFFRPGQYDRGK